MTNSIKCFLEVKKDSYYKLFFIEIFRDFGCKFTDVMDSGATP